MAEDYPRTLLEFEERFATDQACRDYLFQVRWPHGFVCPRCGADRGWAATRARLVCGGCRHQTSVTAETIFQDTRKPAGETLQGPALDRMKAKGVKIHEWSPEMLAKFQQANMEVTQEEARNDAAFARVWDSLSKFQKNYAEWRRLSRIAQ